MKSKSKPKRQPQQAAKSRVRKHASRPRRPRATPTALLLFLGGLALMVNGVAVTIGPDHLPQLADWARLVERADVPGAMQLLVGTVLFGLGLVARYQRVHTGTLLEPSQAEISIEEFVAEVADFRLQVQELQHDNIEFKKLIAEVKKEVVDHRHEQRTDHSKDALFRLAASLDQVGARIEGRIGEAAAGLQSGLDDVSSMIEASRDYLQESLDDVTRRVQALDGDEPYETHEPRMAHVEHHAHEDHGHARYEAPGAPAEVAASHAPALQLADHGDHEVPEPELDPEEDTIVTVEFEDENAAPASSAGLGLLDSLDDYGSSASGAEPPPHHEQAYGSPIRPPISVDPGEVPGPPLPRPSLRLDDAQETGYAPDTRPHGPYGGAV